MRDSSPVGPRRRALHGTGPLAAAVAVVVLALHGPAPAQQARVVVDDAGRRVEIPAAIERVFPAGPLGTILLYTLARDLLPGWYRPLTLDERAFIPERYADLPVMGKLTGRSNVPDLEIVRRARPDLIFDYGTITPAYVALAERVTKETGVPYLLLDGGLSNIPRAYTLLGDLLGVGERASRLARYAGRVVADVDARVARVPADRRPRVYYARGPKGLETEVVESLDRLGAENVASGRIERGPLVPVTLADVVGWNPDVIVTIHPGFFASVAADPGWQGIKAVQDGRVYLAPLLPFAWMDLPPSVNRLIGLKWLGKMLYPEIFTDDLRRDVQEFYSLFYQHALAPAQLDALTQPRTRAERCASC
jgi:iron complex transport system substrate-binding protein